MTRDLEYEANNVEYDEQCPEGGVKCKNFDLCKSVLPLWWYDCKGCYFCINCLVLGYENISFEEVECPICLATTDGVVQPQCQHGLCIPCFKRLYFGDEMEESKPKFPYPEIKDEFFDNEEDPKWKEYPLIDIFLKKEDEWFYEVERKKESESHLRKCPMCRRVNIPAWYSKLQRSNT